MQNVFSLQMFSHTYSTKVKTETHKAWWIVIFHCFGIAKRFEDGVGLEQLAF